VSSVAVTVPLLKKIGTRYEAVLMENSQIHKFHIHAGSVLKVRTRDQRKLTDRFYILIQNSHQEIPNQRGRIATEFSKSNSSPKS